MKSKLLTIVTSLSALVLVAGCGTSAVERNVEQMAATETGAPTRADMMDKGRTAITDSKNLTEKQKTDMLELHAKTAKKVTSIRNQMGKLKSVFFKNLVGTKNNNKELKVVRKKLVKLNDEKMTVMLEALDSAKKILGKDIAKTSNVELLQGLWVDGVPK